MGLCSVPSLAWGGDCFVLWPVRPYPCHPAWQASLTVLSALLPLLHVSWIPSVSEAPSCSRHWFGCWKVLVSKVLASRSLYLSFLLPYVYESSFLPFSWAGTHFACVAWFLLSFRHLLRCHRTGKTSLSTSRKQCSFSLSLPGMWVTWGWRPCLVCSPWFL